VLLISRARSPEAFAFYHAEALRGGWAVRQLKRQIDSQFYERTALSRNKAAMLTKGAKAQPGDAVSADEEIRHPLVLEFLGLRDEYSESDLEAGLIRYLETFLLELGNDFAFVGRQRRLRIDADPLLRGRAGPTHVATAYDSLALKCSPHFFAAVASTESLYGVAWASRKNPNVTEQSTTSRRKSLTICAQY
jgi:predicted nuclease of restriction endonuclease-like (RecB) superfamily